MINFVIIGAGREGRAIAETTKIIDESDDNFKFLGFIDEFKENQGKIINEIRVLGGLDWIEETFTGAKLHFVCAIGDTINRKEVVERALKAGYIPYSIIHPSVIVSYGVKIGDGVRIGPNSVIGPNVVIKDHVLISPLCSIAQDDVINDYCNIGPQAALSGNVVLGEGVYFGTNASVIPSLYIGRWSIIGANACIVKDVEPYCLMVGVPAIIKLKFKNYQERRLYSKKK